MFSSKKILLTGSSGFIGSKLARELAKRGAHIIKLDLDDGFDISDWDQVRKINSFDIAYHLAARTYLPSSLKNPREFYNTNAIGTLNILELCRLNNAKIIFVSAYVYGTPRYLPIDEKHPLQPLNPYSQSKIISEDLCHGYNRDHKVPVIIVRPSNVYGPNQNNKFVIPTILSQLKSGRVVLDNPEPKRDFIYVDDLIDFFTKVGSHDFPSLEIFNVGSALSYSIQEIVNKVRTIYSGNVQIEYLNVHRKNEIMNVVYDISKSKSLVGWGPKTTLYDGLHKTISSYIC